MTKNLLQIDVSNQEEGEDLIKIIFKNESEIQVNFSKLVHHSKYIRENYKYTEMTENIQNEIESIKYNMNIRETSIKEFFELIQLGKLTFEIEHYRDIYALSEYFCTPKLRAALDYLRDNKLYEDVAFSISILEGIENATSNFETNLLSSIEHFLSSRINECLENVKFKELPISTIYRIIELGIDTNIDNNVLLDFILGSVEARFILFKFIKIHELSDDKLDRLVSFLCDEESRSRYLDFIRFDHLLVLKFRQKCDDLNKSIAETRESLKQEKLYHEETKEELKQEKLHHEETKEELKQEKLYHEETKEELKQEKLYHEETKEELKQEQHQHGETREELIQSKQQNKEIQEELEGEKHMHEEIDKELKLERKQNEIKKQELSENKLKIKQLEEELNQIKTENKRYAQAIVVGGCNRCIGLGIKTNNKNKFGTPIISPPQKLPVDPSSLLSYSTNWCHSVFVTKTCSLFGAGDKDRISNNLHGDANEFT